MLKHKATETTPVEEERKASLALREPVFPSLFATPFPFMRRFFDDVERMFEDIGRTSFPAPSLRFLERPTIGWAPEIELLEKNGQLIVKADLPGLTKNDIKVEISDEEIVIEGERKEEKEEKGEGFYRTERRYGKFSRSVPLPEGAEPDKAKATFVNGVLEITMPLPKRVEPKGRKLEIEEPKTEKAKTAA